MLRWRHGLAIAVLAVLLSACGETAPDSGVEGHVWVGPTCPVVQEGLECLDAPLAADLEIVNSSGRVVARSRSAEDGAYRIPLAAGSYVLTPLPGEAGLPFASPIPFEVPQGDWVTLDLTYDSGIR
jgi:hypothetical protein